MKIDRIIRSKRKSVALIVKPDGTLEVRAPRHVSERQIQRFVNSKADWVKEKQSEVKRKSLRNPPVQFKPGEQFYFLGEKYALKHVSSQRERLKLEKDFLLNVSCQSKDCAEKAFTDWYREQARAMFTERVEFYAQRGGFHYNKMRITSARTRWGSCSSKGNINFNWRLVQPPLEIIDYVIVHELCHLQQPNHSHDFWRLVERNLSDYKQRRKWLKQNGAQFQRF